MRLFLYNFAPAKARGGENVVPLHGRPATAHLKAYNQHDSTIHHVQLHSTSNEHERLFLCSHPAH